MKKQILTTVLVMLISTLFAQENERPLNSIQVNIFGDASIISINYDKQFLISQTFILSSKIGLGYNEDIQICIFGPCSSSPEKYLTIPHHITGNLGKGKHFFEFGLGGTIICGNTNPNYFLYPIVGYRILPLNSNKVNFRVFAQIPFNGLESEVDLNAPYFIPLGLSIGISF